MLGLRGQCPQLHQGALDNTVLYQKNLVHYQSIRSVYLLVAGPGWRYLGVVKKENNLHQEFPKIAQCLAQHRGNSRIDNYLTISASI
jgi:hypothetical protein